MQNYISHKVFIFRAILKNSYNLTIKNAKKNFYNEQRTFLPIKYTNGQKAHEDVHCHWSLKNCKSKTTMIHHFTPTGMAFIKKMKNKTC